MQLQMPFWLVLQIDVDDFVPNEKRETTARKDVAPSSPKNCWQVKFIDLEVPQTGLRGSEEYREMIDA